MTQLVQAVGSLLILVPFVLAQTGRMPTNRVPYLALNAVGSTALAIDAGLTRQWGFLLLESVWALVSVVGIIRHVRFRVWPMHRFAPGAQQQSRTQQHEGQGLS
jgi:hypothetical protein